MFAAIWIRWPHSHRGILIQPLTDDNSYGSVEELHNIVQCHGCNLEVLKNVYLIFNNSYLYIFKGKIYPAAMNGVFWQCGWWISKLIYLKKNKKKAKKRKHSIWILKMSLNSYEAKEWLPILCPSDKKLIWSALSRWPTLLTFTSLDSRGVV